MVFRTTTALEGLLVLFDPSVQYVAVINQSDGRIRVFNAVTCALHVDITKKLGSKGRSFTSNLCSACWSVQVRAHSHLLPAASTMRCALHDRLDTSPTALSTTLCPNRFPNGSVSAILCCAMLHRRACKLQRS